MIWSKSARPSFSFRPIDGHFVIILLVLSTNVCHPLHTLEQPVRESLLRPRSYNPHPYQTAYHHHSQSDQLLDGLNTIDSGAENYVENNLFGLNGLGQTIGSSLPARHPSNGLFSQAPHQFPPTLPPANSNARNLNSQPFVTLRNRINDRLTNSVADETSYTLPKKQYAFSYTVHDKQSGDDFSHTQQQKNGAVQGTYKVQLPDGRTQVVRYTADNDGYRADVSYIIEKNEPEPHHHQHHPHYPHHHQPAAENYANHYDPNAYNVVYDASSVSLTQPVPTSTSAVYFTTSQPPAAIDIANDNLFALSLEQRKSISARPTYVVSAKSTQITDNHHDHSRYYKPAAHHHTVFYKAV